MSKRGLRAAVLLGLALVPACATPGPSTPEPAAYQELELALRALGGSADPIEAARLARAVVDATAELRARYRPLRPALVGNLAFYLGLRERALCCHWVEDLLRSLTALEIQGFELHWGVAHFGNRLREHSALVVVPRGRALEQGLVLDAWRHSGRLYWSRLDRDRYPWQLHPSDARRDRLACRARGPG